MHEDDLAARFESFGWYVLSVPGNSIQALHEAFEEAKEAKAFLTVEMNILGQMVDDVKLATEGKYPVDHYGSIFEIPETDGIIAKAKEMLKKGEI